MKETKQLKREEESKLIQKQEKTSTAKSFESPTNTINFTVQKKANTTGLPDNLKSGIENLSGHSMDDVKVHYNSSQPAQLNAHAFAQGNQIHIAPGQQKHLAHEAWHVVQQKQGRVKPTKQLKSSVAINDSPALEKEADVMGAKATQMVENKGSSIKKGNSFLPSVKQFFWTRWYEFDGENYIARTIGLPSMTGWIKLTHQHEGKDAYISIHNITKMPELQRVEQGVTQIRNLVDEHTPLITGIAQGLRDQEHGLNLVRQAQAEFLHFNQALGNYLTQTSTFVKLLGLVLGLTVGVIGGVLISYLYLPVWAVATIEGLSFLYGCGLLYRWAKSDLLHPLAKIALLSVNISAMAIGAGIPLAQMIAYLTGIISTSPFHTVHFAAVPFALLIEHVLVVMLEKVNALRIAYNQHHGHNNVDHMA